MSRRVTTMALVLVSGMALAACSTDEPERPTPSPSATSQTPEKPRQLTFGVFGHRAEIAAFQEVVDSFNASSQTRQVKLVSWSDHREAADAIVESEPPDVFMASRRDLSQVAQSETTRPVSLLLDERGVDFGDRFSRDALEAFSYDDDLQCMPYSASPMVMYFNDELVDFDKMERRELDVPPVNNDGVRSDRWTLAEFAAAAQFAVRRGNVDGVWIDPTLRGLAPFIYSGGGKVFDDEDDPKSTAFADDDTRSALDETLAVLRDPILTPRFGKLRRASALELFKSGKLAMIAGFRDLVPELRAARSLSFDTISMPVIDNAATVGDIDGLCISATTEHVNDAADLLAYAVSDTAMEVVTRTGYIMPANTEVAGSEAFLATDLEPAHSTVFNSAVRGMVVPPLLDKGDELDQELGPLLKGLVVSPGILDLEAATEEIDEVSRTILDPESASETPTE